jgi:hypothetical protein
VERKRELRFTAEAEAWVKRLEPEKANRVTAATDQLQARGPVLRRPLVGTIVGSRHHNMKELRMGTMRMLFAFDPQSHAVMLLGGDKRGAWNDWYRQNIPRADRLYDQHLHRNGKGGSTSRRDPPNHGR